MNRLIIDLDALRNNLNTVGGWMTQREAQWSVVTKVLCGHTDTLKALQLMGVRSMGDSRLMNLRAIDRIADDFEAWYLRLPHFSATASIVKLADVSLNSETRIIEALSEEARRQGKMHRIIIMIELGDLREGILPGTLVRFYQHVFELSNIEVLGIGANLGCLAGSVPNVDQFTQLALYRELLELKFQRKLPLISAGSSSVLPLTLDGDLPPAINHFRIGESIFLGSDLVNGGTLPNLRDDVMVLRGEIAEIKEKGMVPLGEATGITPFQRVGEPEYSPGERALRALVTIGQLDTDVPGLTPVDDRYNIVGASSDLTVVNLADNPEGLKVGDAIKFRMNYSALLRLMSGQYIAKSTNPDLETFEAACTGRKDVEVSPVLRAIEDKPQWEREANR